VTRFVFIAAFCLAVSTGNESRSEPLAAPILEGSVQQRLVLDKALLESFSPVSVDMTFETDKGKKSGRYTGVLLWSLIEKAGLADVSAKNAALRHNCSLPDAMVMLLHLPSVKLIPTTRENP
jgi:hypothetical protein